MDTHALNEIDGDAIYALAVTWRST